MRITVEENRITVDELPCFDLGLSADCGQAFRWKQNENSRWCAIVRGEYLEAEQSNGKTYFYTSPEVFESLWRCYFDLDTDYQSICSTLAADEHLKKATCTCPGIRILRQDPWEALCSFIISQNNNIPRIKGIIERLCESFGEKTPHGFTFPEAQTLAALEPEDLAPLRAGFRAKYIIDAARKVSNNEVDFEKIKASPIEFGREELQKIKGVGAKVAECTLLYGFYKVEAFPVDVWVRRIMEEMYPNGFPECADKVQGIAQQYLFHWRRTCF